MFFVKFNNFYIKLIKIFSLYKADTINFIIFLKLQEKMHKVSKSLGLAVSDSEDDVVQVEDTEINIVDPVNTSAEEAPTPKRKSERKKYSLTIMLLSSFDV